MATAARWWQPGQSGAAADAAATAAAAAAGGRTAGPRVGSMPESMEERVLREKRERYEQSDEYKQIQADHAQTASNVELAASSQVTEADLTKQRQASQGDAETIARKWIEDVLGAPLADGDVGSALKTGVRLCEVVNKLQPGMIPRISRKTMPFPQRENIKAFTDAARTLGVPDSENFETGDLFEQSNMKQVLICIQSLGRAAKRIKGYIGPTLSVGGGGSAAGRSKRLSKVRSLSQNLKIGMAVSCSKPPN